VRATTFFCLWTKVYHVAWKSLVRIFSLQPRNYMTRTLNFRPKLKFLQLNFFSGEPRPGWGGDALGSLGQSLTRVKI